MNKLILKKEKIMKSIFCILLALILSSIKIFAFNLENHFYAYGQNNTIEVFWNYIGVDDLIGCNLLRSEEPNGQFTQINDELIVPTNNEFHYIDTDAIVDTLNYSYKCNYVFADTTSSSSTYGSFKNISLEIIDEDSIELNVILRNSYFYELRWFVDWSVYYYSVINDSLTLELTPDLLLGYGEDYIFMFSELSNPSNAISFHLTYDYLIYLLNISDSFNNQIYSGNLYLRQNFPNPFNPSTTIEFSIQIDSQIELSIYNIKGQKIKTLTRNEFEKGSHSIIWNGVDEFGKQVSSGVYYYKLNVNGKTEAVKKCLLLK